MAEIELPNPEEIEELKEKSFSRRVALVTAFYAVMLAVTSLGGNNATKDLMLAQQQASDQWAFYQAKALREQVYNTQRTAIEMAALDRSLTPASKAKLDSALNEFSTESARYNSEKKEIEAGAKKLEAARDLSLTKDPYFDYAEVMLQIAIVLASISILATSGPVFLISVAAAATGAFLSLDGFLLFLKIPFF